MNKKPICVYIFLVDAKDHGAIEHIRAIHKYMNLHTMYPISNTKHAFPANNLEIPEINFSLVGSWLSQMYKLLKFQLHVIRAIRNLHKGHKSNLIILQRQSIGMFLPALYCKIANIPFVSEMNGLITQDLIDRKKGIITRLFNTATEFITYNCSSKIILVHQNLKDFVINKYKIPAERLLVIENGTHPVRWITAKDQKANLKLPQQINFIGYLGSFTPREGVENTIRSLKYIEHPNVRLMVIGGKTVEEIKTLESIARSEKVLHMIDFFGFKPYDLAMKYIAACDVLIHLRVKTKIVGHESQGSPLKMLDYHNVGRPVIATDISSYEYISRLDFGHLVADGDIRGAAAAIDNILSLPDKGIKSGLKAREYVRDNHLWQKSVMHLEEALAKEIYG